MKAKPLWSGNAALVLNGQQAALVFPTDGVVPQVQEFDLSELTSEKFQSRCNLSGECVSSRVDSGVLVVAALGDCDVDELSSSIDRIVSAGPTNVEVIAWISPGEFAELQIALDYPALFEHQGEIAISRWIGRAAENHHCLLLVTSGERDASGELLEIAAGQIVARHRLANDRRTPCGQHTALERYSPDLPIVLAVNRADPEFAYFVQLTATRGAEFVDLNQRFGVTSRTELLALSIWYLAEGRT